MSQIKWNYLILSYLALFCLGLIDNTRGAFYPEFLRQMDFSASEGSRLFSVVALSGFIMNFTTRYWLPHVGIVKAILASLFFMFLGTIMVSLMPFFMEFKHSMLIISGLCLGLGIGGSTISMNLLVTKAAPPRLMSRAFSGLHSTYGVSSLIAPLLFNFLFVLLGKWNLAYLCLSFFPLVIFSFYLLKNLQKGDDVIVFFQGVRHNYKVSDSKIVGATDVSYIVNSQNQASETLILQTCWPPGTTWQRLLIFAKPNSS